MERLSGHILIAEDGKDTQRILSHFLKDMVSSFEIVENGKQAVEIGLKVIPQLTLMDMQMPEMDGYEATEKLRAGGLFAPIIALTANSKPEQKAKAINCGCEDILPKPFSKQELYKVLSEYLAPEENAGDDDFSFEDYQSQSPGYGEIIEQFREGIPEREKAFRKALQTKDWEKLKALAHKLAVAGMFGHEALGDLALEAEDLLEEKKNQEAEEKIQIILKEFTKLRPPQ